MIYVSVHVFSFGEMFYFWFSLVDVFHVFLCNPTATCQNCAGFKSSYTCGCGEPYTRHEMIIETKEEREERGHPVGRDNPYQAMGGLTGFSSLAEGYMRLDPSGRGEIS